MTGCFTELPKTIHEIQKTPGLHVIEDSDFYLKNIDAVYQKKHMVYGPGGYRFADFLKIGIVMNPPQGIIVTFIVFCLFF